MSQPRANSSSTETKPTEKDLEQNLALAPKRKKKLFGFLFKQNPPVPESQGVYPEPNLNFFSKYTFTWIGPILKVRLLRLKLILIFLFEKIKTNCVLLLRLDMLGPWK